MLVESGLLIDTLLCVTVLFKKTFLYSVSRVVGLSG